MIGWLALGRMQAVNACDWVARRCRGRVRLAPLRWWRHVGAMGGSRTLAVRLPVKVCTSRSVYERVLFTRLAFGYLGISRTTWA